MKKILFVYENNISQYNIPYIKMLKENGIEVHIVSNDKEKNDYCDKYYFSKFTKKLFSYNNLKVYRKLKNIISQNKYDIIQCDNYICGILTRLAARKQKCKIIYRNFSLANNIFEYFTEKVLSKYTNIIITTNIDDYNFSKKKLNIKDVKLMNGIGIDKGEKVDVNRNKEFYTFFSIGELNKKNNQIIQLEAMIEIIRKYPQTQLIISGDGKQKEYYEHIIEKYGLRENVKIYSNSENLHYTISEGDCFISTAKRDYFPIYIIKMMFNNKPIIASNIKEYKNLLKNKNLFKQNNVNELKRKMFDVIEKNKKYEIYYDIEKYKSKKVLKEMKIIYEIKN